MAARTWGPIGIAVACMAAGAAGATGAGAQSLTSLRGLGYPMLPADARSEALGGLGIGLIGLAVPLTNPAAPAGVIRRGVVVTAAANERTTSLGDASDRHGATRFPLMRIIFPAAGVVFTGGYGSYLDQSWAVVKEGTQPLGSGSVAYEDVLESVGGVGEAQLGVAMPVGERLAVGIAVGALTGSQALTIRRTFDDTTAAGDLQDFAQRREFQYSGPSARIGVRWDPSPQFRIGAALTWAGTLRADSASGPIESRQFELPLQAAAGASAFLAPGLLAAVSGRWSGWSVTDPTGGLVDADVPVTARDTWEVGAGLELDDPASRQSRTFPLRLGFQYRQLPFTFVSDSPSEWVASGGVGMRVGDFETPLARIDLTVQRGGRSAAGDGAIPALEESFWRVALSLSIFGT